jgi:hypothetical protein
MKTVTRFAVFLLITLTLMTSVIHAQRRPPESERGAIVRVVTRWNSSCSGDDLRSFDNMVDNWYDDITSDREHGSRAWWRDGFYENGNIVDSDFTDPDVVSWGNDLGDDRVDEADAILVGLHGRQGTGNQWDACVRVDEPGAGNCWSWQGHMRFGDEDLEFLHLVSCHSMNQDVWDEWLDSFEGLHQADGFHGITYVSRFYGHRYTGFSDDAFDTSIASSWVDNLYKYKWRNRNMCPVARGVGFDRPDLWDRMDHEQYDWVYSDPVGADQAGTIWISGCNPRGASALPD